MRAPYYAAGATGIAGNAGRISDGAARRHEGIDERSLARGKISTDHVGTTRLLKGQRILPCLSSVSGTLGENHMR